MDWFLYDNGPRHERVKNKSKLYANNFRYADIALATFLLKLFQFNDKVYAYNSKLCVYNFSLMYILELYACYLLKVQYLAISFCFLNEESRLHLF